MILNQNPTRVNETLIEGTHYYGQMDGMNTVHKIANILNFCKREGIVEFVPLKYAKGIGGQPKHDNYKSFSVIRDRKTKLLLGNFSHVDYDSKALKFFSVTVEGALLLDRSIDDQAIKAFLIENGPYCEGSPNLVGKPTYKVKDKEKIAESNIDKRTLRRKAEDIIKSLNREQIIEMALNIGVNISANSNQAMLEDEVYRVMEINPGKFIDIYTNPNREYISIFNKALSVGVIVHNVATGIYMYGGLTMGHNPEMAVKYLVDNKGIATTISMICSDNDVKSNISMATNTVELSEEDEMAALEAKLASMKAKQPKKEDSTLVGVESKVEKVEDAEMVDLRLRAKALKIQGYHLHTLTKEVLLKKIEDAESK